MKKTLFLLLSIAFLYSCGTYQNQSSYRPNDMPNEPGKCYAKCLTPDIITTENIAFPIYFGNDEEILRNHVSSETIELSPKSTEWVKKKADRNCKSADPNDCLVWCLVERPAQKITIENILRDTTASKEYEIETFDLDFVSSNGGQTVWMEVICDPSAELISALQARLNDDGYDLSVEMLQGVFGSASKKALKDYQKNNGLHVGGLTEELIDFLNLEY